MPVFTKTDDAQILRQVTTHLLSVHDIRAALTAHRRGEHDYIAAEEISEQAKKILVRCAARGWIRHRPNYPGRWERTARFHLEAPSVGAGGQPACASRVSTKETSAAFEEQQGLQQQGSGIWGNREAYKAMNQTPQIAPTVNPANFNCGSTTRDFGSKTNNPGYRKALRLRKRAAAQAKERSCDGCGSMHLIETNHSFVCRYCGITSSK